jgi:hypothetical protein
MNNSGFSWHAGMRPFLHDLVTKSGRLFGVEPVTSPKGSSTHAINLATDRRAHLYLRSSQLCQGELHAAAVRELILAQRNAPFSVRNIQRELTDELVEMNAVCLSPHTEPLTSDKLWE